VFETKFELCLSSSKALVDIFLSISYFFFFFAVFFLWIFLFFFFLYNGTRRLEEHVWRRRGEEAVSGKKLKKKKSKKLKTKIKFWFVDTQFVQGRTRGGGRKPYTSRTSVTMISYSWYHWQGKAMAFVRTCCASYLQRRMSPWLLKNVNAR